jgi:uncharacterized protein YidB (DUF937 family)
MGILDGIKKAVGLGAPGRGGMADHLLGLINSPEIGGIDGLVEKFKKKGLGKVISSWIGTGKNLPITAEQISKVFGTAKITEIAGKLGVSAKDAAGQLASLLPRVIDGLTPDGAVPAAAAVASRFRSLKQKLLQG